MKKHALNAATIKKLDRSAMRELLMDFPSQCAAARELAEKAGILFQKRDFSRIVFAGLGGSAIGADLVRSYLYFESALPILVYREYELPACVDASALVFIASYSGNTEETLSAYAQARAKGATLIVLSSGGALKEMAQRDNVTFVEIPGGIPPRCALGYQSIIPLVLLGRLGLVKDISPQLREAISELEVLRDRCLSPLIAQKDNVAKTLASKLFDKLAVIYSGSLHFDVVATRLRCQLNENSKALASSHVFPEMNHNEIVGWEHPRKLFKSLVVVMFRDEHMHPRILKRMEITSGILRKEGVAVIDVWSRGRGLLSRIFSLLYIGDFVSFYLAILYGMDPTPVERVTYLKNELAKE